MIKEIINFSVKFNANLIDICSIQNRKRREKESMDYRTFIDLKINLISSLCSNDKFIYALEKYRSFIIENLINCSYEEDIKKRIDMCSNFSEIFIKNISKSLEYLKNC